MIDELFMDRRSIRSGTSRLDAALETREQLIAGERRTA